MYKPASAPSTFVYPAECEPSFVTLVDLAGVDAPRSVAFASHVVACPHRSLLRVFRVKLRTLLNLLAAI
jgi:hypothetical protein